MLSVCKSIFITRPEAHQQRMTRLKNNISVLEQQLECIDGSLSIHAQQNVTRLEKLLKDMVSLLKNTEHEKWIKRFGKNLLTMDAQYEKLNQRLNQELLSLVLSFSLDARNEDNEENVGTRIMRSTFSEDNVDVRARKLMLNEENTDTRIRKSNFKEENIDTRIRKSIFNGEIMDDRSRKSMFNEDNMVSKTRKSTFHDDNMDAQTRKLTISQERRKDDDRIQVPDTKIPEDLTETLLSLKRKTDQVIEMMEANKKSDVLPVKKATEQITEKPEMKKTGDTKAVRALQGRTLQEKAVQALQGRTLQEKAGRRQSF